MKIFNYFLIAVHIIGWIGLAQMGINCIAMNEVLAGNCGGWANRESAFTGGFERCK